MYAAKAQDAGTGIQKVDQLTLKWTEEQNLFSLTCRNQLSQSKHCLIFTCFKSEIDQTHSFLKGDFCE